MTDAPGAPGAADDAGSICVGCGLCCDGTLFSHLTALDEADLGLPLRMLGVEVIVRADPPVFALPCPAVVEGRCTVYELHRPRACHEFNCDLVTQVASGAMTEPAARRVIAETFIRRDQVRAGQRDREDFDRWTRTHFGV